MIKDENEFEELFDVLMAEEISNLKEELESHYMRQSVMCMSPEDWDDIMYVSRSWQQRMRDVINASKI